jgi:hypothetical protein
MRFEKQLSRNDIGLNGSHQSGFLIPKSNRELISFLPQLNPEEINPSKYIDFVDLDGQQWRFRYIYYNTKLHGTGTRNEYRITCTSKFMKQNQAKEGDVLSITKDEKGDYLIHVKTHTEVLETGTIVKLRGWRTVY